ncbi:TPA: hypothetical protein N0F65_000043 [Lagenidium giganteum]|uniref:G-protein coupled receptors family 3 profile domain-containing protein n=1 Tax=Lagenidium giganteum TaxID=4803 RepID=A0AAV2YQJ6_9STRA|nr:TPA: hypothetical protein N0F65_000043 [Lagenidium giganteum]
MGDRDAMGRLVHPFLRPSLKHRRFHCFSTATDAFYGARNQYVNDTLVDPGVINGTLILELKDWQSNAIATLVFGILAQEVEMMIALGTCTPIHANVEVWTEAHRAEYVVYANETYCAGGLGYFGRSGVYVSHSLVVDGANRTKRAQIFNADFYRDYAANEDLIRSLPVSQLWNNSKYYPPAQNKACVDGRLGCKNNCSKSLACTKREAAGKECLVIMMMKANYDVGMVQAIMSNNDVPAYFCFLGYTNMLAYVVEAEKNGTPVAFYHYEPDTFFFDHAKKFDRIFLPRATPEEVALNTFSFGELGYGNATTNPLSVDFPSMRLDKYASMLLQVTQPIGNFLNQFSLVELNLNQLLNGYEVVMQMNPPAPDPIFTTACTWIEQNYDTWRAWIDRLPLCDFNQHVKYTISNCDGDNDEDSSANHTITFAWHAPDPDDPTQPYECDGGIHTLPNPLTTSRSCAWLRANPTTWANWISTKPQCDFTFEEYSITECTATATRNILFSWKLPKPDAPTESMECSGGVKLSDNLELPCDYMPASAAGYIVIVVFAVILIIVHIAATAFVYICRKRPIIKRLQYEFLLLMIVGGILMCLSVIVYGGEPTPFLCGARPTFLALGFTMIFGSLVVKSMRVYRVFTSTAMKRVVLSMGTMLKVLSVFFAVDIMILIVWFAADFPKPTTLTSAMVELHGGTIGSKVCRSSSFIFSALLIFWKAIVLGMGIYLSFLIRHLSSDFQESIWIFGSSMVVLGGSLLIMPMAYLADLQAVTFYIFMAVTLLICTSLVTIMMLLPKVRRLNEQATSSQTDGTKQSTQTGGRVVNARRSVPYSAHTSTGAGASMHERSDITHTQTNAQ